MTALMIASATLTGCGTGSAPAGQQASGNITLDTALTAAEKEARIFTPEVMWKMGRIGSSSLSPDGKEVLYALTYYNMADNKGYTSLYVMPLGEPDQARQITDNSGKDNSPAWGIDPTTGRTTVYFLSSRGKDSQGETTPQLWAVGSDGSGMRQLSSVAGGITGTMDAVLQNIFDFAQSGVDIALGLIGTMAFFCGLMKLMEESGLCDKLGKAIYPVMRLLFPDVPKDHPANSIMALYFAANILGIGNAATPFGLKTMQELQTLNKTKNIATNAQCMLMAISTTSITLLPSTVISIRASIQADGAAEIVVPVIIATTISTITGVTFSLLFQRTKRWKLENVIEREIAAGTLEVNEDYIGDDPIVLPEGYKLKTDFGSKEE